MSLQKNPYKGGGKVQVRAEGFPRFASKDIEAITVRLLRVLVVDLPNPIVDLPNPILDLPNPIVS